MEEQDGKLVPIRRDYLLEAIKIAEGGAFKAIRREHVRALYDVYTAVCAQHSALKRTLQNIANQAIKIRQAQGLPTGAPVVEKKGPEDGKTE